MCAIGHTIRCGRAHARLTTGGNAHGKHGKSYNAAAEKIDRATLYTPLQAAKLIKELDTAKFDETV